MKRFLVSIQRATGLTSTEAIVVVSLALVLTIGWIGSSLSPKPATHDSITISRIANILDSLETSAVAPISRTQSRIDTLPHGQISTLSRGHMVKLSNGQIKTSGQIGARRVDLNTASKQQLMRLPGVGPSTADKIIEHRKNRKFTSVDDLLDVKGIGPAKLAKIRAYATVP